MYVPPHFAETRPDVLYAMMRRHSFACVVGQVDGQFIASHVPTLLCTPGEARVGQSPGPWHPSPGAAETPGVIQCHLARQNPECRALASGQEVMVVFQGPHAYISPRWYVTRQVVPTWNYVVVHAYGRPRPMDHAALREHIGRLVEQYEGGAAKPWRLSDVPEDFIQKLMGAIQGFDIPIARLEGKWKLGQNRSAEDRRGVVAGLRAGDDPVGHALAELMGGPWKSAGATS